jgi:hypothetical protein
VLALALDGRRAKDLARLRNLSRHLLSDQIRSDLDDSHQSFKTFSNFSNFCVEGDDTSAKKTPQ